MAGTKLGYRIVFNNLPKISAKVRQEVRKVVVETTYAVEQRAKVAIQSGPKTGRIYYREDAPPHRASAPGEAPATDTGDLAASINSEMIGELTGRVDVGAEHGVWLEFGTVGGKTITPKKGKFLVFYGADGKKVFARKVVLGPIAPRPFLGPAVEGERDNFNTDVAAATRRGSGE